MDLFTKIDGTCPYCRGPVDIIESSLYDYTLDKDGFPNKLNHLMYKVAAYCLHCNIQLMAIPHFGKYMIYPTFIDAEFVLDPNRKESAALVSAKLLECDETNPFVNTNEPSQSITTTMDNLNDESKNIVAVCDKLLEDEIPF